MNTWFEQLTKPSWAPPAWIFGPVWAFLYLIIAITFIYVGWLFIKGKIGLMVLLPFILNLILDYIFQVI